MPNDTESLALNTKTDSSVEKSLYRTAPDQEMHERNIEFLANRFTTCKGLAGYVPQTQLSFLENGEATVMLGAESLYGTEGANTFTEKQYDTFWHAPSRVLIPPQTGEGLDEYSYAFYQNLLKTVHDDKIQVYQFQQTRTSDHVKVFGIGLAPHLERLLIDTRCHTMLLIEPNLEFIYHSTFVFDWVGFFEKAKEFECEVALISTTNTNLILHVIRDYVLNHNVMTFDGTLIYKHYPNQFFAAAEDKLKQEMVSFLSALGYTEDEFYMLGNSYINFMKREDTKIFRPRIDNKIDTPVFIVGGGPSKDNFYQVLRDNQDKAIIVACGSALESLLQEDIIPDIYVLLERSPKVYESLKKTAEKWDLSDITLVGSTTIDPRIQDYFKTSLFFYRQALCPYQMFGKANGFFLEGPDPHVGNAAFSFILLSGFRNIYLFGLDLGSRDADVHHSKNSLPMQKGTIHDFHELNIKTSGSFGGTIYTCKQFLLVRTNIEQMALKYNKKGIIYNCSDGIKIKNTLPKLPHNLKLPLPPIPKEHVIKDIADSFWPQPRDQFKDMWERYDIRSQLKQFHDEFLDIVKSDADFLEDNTLTKLHRYLHTSIHRPQSTPAIMIRGNIHMMMIGAWYYLNRVAPAYKEQMRQAIIASLTKTLDTMVSDTMDLVDDLEAWDPEKAPTIERLMT